MKTGGEGRKKIKKGQQKSTKVNKGQKKVDKGQTVQKKVKKDQRRSKKYGNMFLKRSKGQKTCDTAQACCINIENRVL